MAVIRRCAEMRIIAFINDAMAVCEILAHLGEATSPPRLAPDAEPGASDPWASQFDPQAQPAPDYEFDQRITW